MSSIERKLSAVLGNSQRLDGGAMFGNAPRALWTRWLKPDELNRVSLACRAMLIEEHAEGHHRNILFEAGIGAYLDPKMAARFGVVESEHRLLANLAELGLSDSDIDVVFLSHLHFDHCGGLLTPWSADTPSTLLFPNATFVVGELAWQRATHPHVRDRASFISQLHPLLEASGRLEIVPAGEQSETLGPAYRLHVSHGHTPGMLLTELPSEKGPIVFTADLVPGRPWVHLPITMGYDRYPELLIDEKHALLNELIERNGRVFFTHDSEIALGRLHTNERGRFEVIEQVANPTRMVL